MIISVQTKQISLRIRRRMSSSSSSSSGIGFPGLLTVLFIGLKLTGHITWPWVWVLSPMWISALIFLVLAAIIFILAIIAGK